MYCAQCGALNDDNAYACTTCGRTLLRPGQVTAPAPPLAAQAGFNPAMGLNPAPAHLAQSIIVTVLCCMPAGVPAIVYSAQTMSHNSAGRYDEAARTSKLASMWGWISFGVGLCVMLGYGALVALGALAGNTP